MPKGFASDLLSEVTEDVDSPLLASSELGALRTKEEIFDPRVHLAFFDEPTAGLPNRCSEKPSQRMRPSAFLMSLEPIQLGPP